jgi:hypothetical protein
MNRRVVAALFAEPASRRGHSQRGSMPVPVCKAGSTRQARRRVRKRGAVHRPQAPDNDAGTRSNIPSSRRAKRKSATGNACLPSQGLLANLRGRVAAFGGAALEQMR